MGRKWKRERDDSGSMLATIIIIVLGTVLCCFLCLLDSSAFAHWMLLLLPTSALVVIVQIARYRYGRSGHAGGASSGLSFWNLLARNPPDDGLAAQYRPRVVQSGRSLAPSGLQQPITAQEAHELRTTSANTWVPSQGRQRPRPEASNQEQPNSELS